MTDNRSITPNPHAVAIANEVSWLSTVIEGRLSHFFEGAETDYRWPAAPDHDPQSALGGLIRDHKLSEEARLVLVLGIAVHVDSAALDPFCVKNSAIDRGFSQFGGELTASGAFRPSVETALFLIAGSDTVGRIQAMQLFEPDHPLIRIAGLKLERSERGQHNRIELPVHRVVAFCDGTPPRPDFSPDFPAKRLQTALDWDDLILPAPVLDKLDHILAWLDHRDLILSDWGLGRQVGRGYKALFYGPPGTGKTLTATLLGKRSGLDVYRVDLSMVVSKYIGETEKNLGIIFDLAAERDWILFFDEADALFGSRTTTSSSHDRYANQEVSYLLQRVEECQSLVILATNLRTNIDDAFFRRFQASVGFTAPDAQERARLWTNVLKSVPVAEDVVPADLARNYELTGAAIVNIARHAAITAKRRGSDAVAAADLRGAVADEMRKEGRTP